MLTLVLADCKINIDSKKIDKRDLNPELVHISMLLAQDSGLAEERELKIIVHTVDNSVFRFEPHSHIPEDLEEFVELLNDSSEGKSPKGVKFKKQSLIQALDEEIGHKIVFSPKGERKDPIEVFSRPEDYIVVIGGFVEGDFKSPVYKWADKTISISSKQMKTWSVTAEVIVSYRYCSFE